MASMYGGGGGKAARAEKKENKKIVKEVSKAVKAAAPKKEKGLTLKQRTEQMAAAKGLAKLDVVSKPLRPSARKEMFRLQRKGK